MDPTGDALLDHLEAWLGEMLDARNYEVERLDDVHVLRFVDVPRAGAATYATFGLSRAELHVAPREHVRLELVCAVEHPDQYIVADWLLTLVEHFAQVQEPPAHDEESGWEGFSRVADGAGADLLDLGRPSVVSRTERPEPCPTCGQTHDYFLPDGAQVPEVHDHR